MNLPRRPLAFARLAPVLLALAAGCDSQEMLQQVIEQAGVPAPGGLVPGGNLTATLDESVETDPVEGVAHTPLPSPGRGDPFRYPEGFQSVQSEGGRTERGDVKLLGFIETDRPRVLISIDGQRGTLAAGESIGRVTVESISIPYVRLSLEGISWNASLFDRSGS